MDQSEIIETLRSFFTAMGSWEAECTAHYRKARRQEISYELAKSDSIEALKDVFRHFCTSWKQPARASKGNLHFSTIPTYGVDFEEITSVELYNDEARVVTAQKLGPKDELVYYLKRIGGEWKIQDTRKRIDTRGVEVDWDL